MSRFSTSVGLHVVAFLFFLPFVAGAGSVILNYRGEVLEETDEYIILKLRKADIELIRDNSILYERKNMVRDGVLKRREHIYLEPESLTRIKSELRKELKADLREEVQKQAVQRGEKVEVGSVEGRIIHKGVGLAACKVKLIRLPEASTLQGIFKEFKKGLEFETSTNKEGKYVFRNIPTGNYQLQWLPKGSRSWIRRLTERPDVTVEKDQTSRAKDVDMKRQVIEG